MFSRRAVLLTGSAALLASRAIAAPMATQPYDTAGGQWRTYGGNLGSWRYSALDQINAQNFHALKPAWTFRTDNFGAFPDYTLQATPLMVDGTLYFTAGTRRAAVAVNAATGELKWQYHLEEGHRAARSPRPGTGRGLSYWTDGKSGRILYVTIG